MKQKYITATNARKNFFDLLNQVKDLSTPVHITMNGIPEAVLISKDHYDGLLATLETLSDPELMEQIKESDENFAKGDYVTLDEVIKEMENESFMVADKDKQSYVPSTPRKPRAKRSQKTGSAVPK
jgi:antitoxin YefM